MAFCFVRGWRRWSPLHVGYAQKSPRYTRTNNHRGRKGCGGSESVSASVLESKRMFTTKFPAQPSGRNQRGTANTRESTRMVVGRTLRVSREFKDAARSEASPHLPCHTHGKLAKITQLLRIVVRRSKYRSASSNPRHTPDLFRRSSRYGCEGWKCIHPAISEKSRR